MIKESQHDRECYSQPYYLSFTTVSEWSIGSAHDDLIGKTNNGGGHCQM